MKQITIISGKGGTGKTFISGAFAVLAKNKVMADCDVDAANLHLLLHPRIIEQHQFKSGFTAYIKSEICIKCDKCRQLCRFDAVKDNYVIDPIACEGCAFCSHVCPVNAIEMQENLSGEWYISETDYGSFVHAKLGIAEENSGKLAALVRQEAKKAAKHHNADWIIIDGPPGIGCPVIASIMGVDRVLIVVEPTLSGIHDFARILELIKRQNISGAIVINKYDINLDNSKKIETICRQQQIACIGKIPYSDEVAQSIANGKIVIECAPQSEASRCVKEIWEKIKNI